MNTGLSALFNVVLVVALLGYFGVETTSFAALMAAGGVAIGVAWARIPKVLATRAPDVDVLQFTLAGPVLCVRPYCNNADYWQVYFDTNRMIREAFGAAGFPAPVPAYALAGPALAPPPDALRA